LVSSFDTLKEILVVAKRGIGVDYKQKGTCVPSSSDTEPSDSHLNDSHPGDSDSSDDISDDDISSESDPSTMQIQTDAYSYPYEYDWSCLDRSISFV
jgi:hypothetical protein